MPEPPPATPGFKCKLPTADEGFLQVPLPFDGSRLSTPTAAPCAASSRLPRKLQKYKFTGTRPLPRPPREGSGPAHRAGSAGTRYGPQPEYLELAQREGPLTVATVTRTRTDTHLYLLLHGHACRPFISRPRERASSPVATTARSVPRRQRIVPPAQR